MRIRRVGFLLTFVMVGYVSLAGCGDDPSTIPDVGDTGTGDSSTPDTSTSNGDTSTSDTSTSDSSSSDSSADANDARSPEYTGSACTTASQCYSTFDAQALKGAPYCIDKVTDGYCTHECVDDTDCCAVPGECKTALKQVCASFENSNKKYCFLSCEAADIAAANDAGLSDAGTGGTEYCAKNTSTEFGCRSTGGGSGNRKVCLPVGTATDAGSDAPSDAPTDAPTDAPDAD